MEARAKVAAARMKCSVVHEKLEEKKKVAFEIEQRAKSAESLVVTLRVELNTVLT